MQAQDLMSKPPVTISESATLEQAAQRMVGGRIGCLLVVDEAGMLKGIITESDFTAKPCGVPFSTLMLPQLFGEWLGAEVEEIFERARRRTVQEIMTPDVACVHPEDPIDDVLRVMLDRQLHRVPVANHGIPLGIITRHDLLRLMTRSAPGGRSKLSDEPKP